MISLARAHSRSATSRRSCGVPESSAWELSSGGVDSQMYEYVRQLRRIGEEVKNTFKAAVGQERRIGVLRTSSPWPYRMSRNCARLARPLYRLLDTEGGS